MAPNKFSTMLHKRSNKITRVLIYAFLEWTLIFLLLLNSLFSYFILKFALYFGLKPPCFLCSRLDHLLDSHRKEKHKKSSFFSFTETICEQHAAEISKVGYCSHHRKLVESKNMCENCSPSPSSSSSTHDPELFKWMTEIGIVKADDDDAEDEVTNKSCCCCCNGVIKKIPKASSSLDFVIKERELLGGCFSDQNVQVGSDQSDDRPNFEYQILGDDTEEDEDDEKREPKDMIIFEAEKEPLLSNNDDNNGKEKETETETVSVIAQNLCPDMVPQHLEFYIDHDDYRLIPVELGGDSIKVEETSRIKETSFELVFEGDELVLPGCLVSTPKNLPSIQEEEEESIFEIITPKNEKNFELDFEQEYDDDLNEDCETQNLQILEDEEREKIDGLEDFELHFEDDSLLAIVSEAQNDEKMKFGLENNIELLFEGNELVNNVCDEMDTKNLPTEEEECDLRESNLLEEQEKITTPENTLILDNEQERAHQATEDAITSVSEEDNASHFKSIEIVLKEENQNPTDKPLIDKYKEDIALNLKNIEIETERDQNSTPELFIEVDKPPTPCRKESYSITDNGISEVSTSCPQDGEIDEESQNEVEEEKVPDTPTPLEGLQEKFLVIGRRESVTEESVDRSEQGNAEETIEKLKEDLITEKKKLKEVYKELEEERNASAIAANQTMAMITRIQEEKATMQMEALQYQRMMEEQSEYDQEALQMMNELVVKREKEKQELEKDLEVYRKKVMDYEERERLRVLSRRRSRNSSASWSYGEESDGVSIDLNQEKDQEEDNHHHHQEENGHQNTPTDAVLCLRDTFIGFEDERQAILEQLKGLEEKLFTLAEEEDEDEENLQNMEPIEQFYEENCSNGGDGNGFVHVNGGDRKMNGSMPKKLLLPLFDAAESLDSSMDEDGLFDIAKMEMEKKRFALEEEVDHVYERLQALEADREFLKHCIGSLRKGDKGLDLLQEILQHLRDLKSVELQAIKNMDHCVSV